MIDRYTKAVLTVIAVSLIALVAQNAVRLARADYNDACGFVGHPACQVTWSSPMPVKVSN